MKRYIKFITALVVICLSSSDLFSRPIVGFSRDRAGCCFLGCSSVEEEKDLFIYTGAGGKEFEGWKIKIKCRGWGFTRCPHEVKIAAIEEDEGDIASSDVAIFSDFSKLISDKIAHGQTSGNLSKTFNVAGEQSFVLNGTWNHSSDENGKIFETIQISKTFL
ncbi:hypothetical protein N9J24_02480 [Bacteroidia bacterium]|nr:hypothetical protein [Bacteroidia bacterium]